MPDIGYRQTKEFRALDGQSEPEAELLEGIFKNARFDTRFYREVQDFDPRQEQDRNGEENDTTSIQKRFIISAALEPPTAPEKVHDFDNWYRNEHLSVLAAAPGFIRSRRYELVSASTLHEFERMEDGKVPKYLALHEFAGENLPWKELGESAETEWAKSVMGGLMREEVGWYGWKRSYVS